MTSVTTLLQRILPRHILSVAPAVSNPVIIAKPHTEAQLAWFMQQSILTRANYLSFRTCVHYPAAKYSILNVSQLRVTSPLSTAKNIMVVSPAAAYSAHPSWMPIFEAANWAEREAHEMFGIHYTGHHDLRSLLLDDIQDQPPLLKSSPLSGISSISHDVANWQHPMPYQEAMKMMTTVLDDWDVDTPGPTVRVQQQAPPDLPPALDTASSLDALHGNLHAMPVFDGTDLTVSFSAWSMGHALTRSDLFARASQFWA